MSSGVNDTSNSPDKNFRGVNGNLIILNETTDSNNSGVIKFVLKNNANFSLGSKALPVIIAVLYTITQNWFVALGGVFVLFLTLLCKYFVSFVNIDTLLVVESVGIQIIGKRIFSSQESSTFIPWNTIQDVFINEVITGVRLKKFNTRIFYTYIPRQK